MCGALLLQITLILFGLIPLHCYSNLADIDCGIELTRQARIVGGSDSLPSEFPWTVSIWRQGAHQCGATVISDRWLLTAGHCICSVFNEIYKPKQLTAVVGYTDLSGHQGFEALSRLIPHPDYRCNMKTNDIALIMTSRQLKWNKDLKPACLPQSFSVNDFNGKLATVTGWGFTHEDRAKGSRPDILQKTDVVVVGNDECNLWYQSQGSKVNVVETQMCAGHKNGGRDSCWADSGGPLIVREKSGHAVIIGVVSTGSGCARPKMPGIYTRISKYMDWIKGTIKGKEPTRLLNWYPK